MRVFTSHLRPRTAPVLVEEGFSWAAFFFGPLYLAAHRAWIAAAANLALLVLMLAVAPKVMSGAPLLGLAVLQGLFGRDLWRWGLGRRGFAEGPVVAAAGEDEALARLVDGRADLLPDAA